ncbi:hypothetical protein Tco_1324854 [Tanacetum coccineum]
MSSYGIPHGSTSNSNCSTCSKISYDQEMQQLRDAAKSIPWHLHLQNARSYGQILLEHATSGFILWAALVISISLFSFRFLLFFSTGMLLGRTGGGRHQTVALPIIKSQNTEIPREGMTARKLVRSLPSYRLALRYTSHHLDHFTFGSSLSHLSLDHSSSGHSISGHSLFGHASPDTTVADSSTPLRFVHPPLTRTPRCSEAYLH